MSRLFALLVHDRFHPLDPVRQALKGMAIDTFSVGTCEEFSHLVSQTHPHLIFTSVLLPDGTWVEILNHAEKTGVPMNVIVVGTELDSGIYHSVRQRGGYAFLGMPLESDTVVLLAKSAGRDALQRRLNLALSAVS